MEINLARKKVGIGGFFNWGEDTLLHVDVLFSVLG
jgi:hypothetical protein